MTIETRFEADDWTPQLIQKKESTNMQTTIATTTTSTLTRAEMVAAIKLRDPNFADSTAYSAAYISGRYAGTIALMPVVGITRRDDPSQPAVKGDAADGELSPVTKAQIAYFERLDEKSRPETPSPTRADAIEELSPVTRAQIAAHSLREKQRDSGGDGSAA